MKRALFVALVIGLLSVPTPRAAAAPLTAITYGQLYRDTLDSRLSAQRVAAAANAVGYSGQSLLAGRMTQDAFSDGQAATIFGFFGHAGAGFIQWEVPGQPDQNMGGGSLTDVAVHLNTPVTSVNTNWTFWKDYVPFVDVDDMLIAIFAGCYTAQTDANGSNLLQMARERGVDSAIGFQQLVYFPSACVDCNSSGNYFWDRFATYVQGGDTVATALSKSGADLKTKEGGAGGWDTWYVRGASPSPGDVRISPPSVGDPLNSKPGNMSIPPTGLKANGALLARSGSVIVQSKTVEIEGRTFEDVLAADGSSYRFENDALVFAHRSASVRGPVALDEASAATSARNFIREFAPRYASAGLAATVRIPSGHRDGEATYTFTWRSTIHGTPGPAQFGLSVDARSGEVVEFAAASVEAATDRFQLTGNRAAQIALGIIDGRIVSASRDVWNDARWTIRIGTPSRTTTPDFTEIVISATTGEVLEVRKT